MQYLKIKRDMRFSDLSEIIGSSNVEQVLALNSMQRFIDIGEQFYIECQRIAHASTPNISAQRKTTILNRVAEDDDVFELMALSSEEDWKVIDALGTLPMFFRLPETMVMPQSVGILGSGIRISSVPYKKTLNDLMTTGVVNPENFNEYSQVKPSDIGTNITEYTTEPFQWFQIPWGKITLYSSLQDASMDFPVYPEGYNDSRSAKYTEMPDMLYQYEPWYVYQNSGPRTNDFSFNMHRDMWTGDHTDGNANKLIRFCEANCYPDYNGSAVNMSKVTLYINGKPLITGILTDVSVEWDGDSPLGHDGWFLHFHLKLTITEVSETPLDYRTVLNKKLIG